MTKRCASGSISGRIWKTNRISHAGSLSCLGAPSHEHGDIAYRPHIHRASEQAIAAGRKAESDATETDRFETLDGALACLTEDFNVTGVKVESDQPRLKF